MFSSDYMFYGSLFAALVVTLLVVSKVAEMLVAKRYSMGWIFTSTLIGAVFAALSYVLVSTFVEGVEPIVKIAISIVTMFVASSGVFKYLNKMSWGSAITTNVASIAVGLIAITAAVVLNGKSFDETLEAVHMTAKTKVSIAETMAEDLKEGNGIDLDALATEEMALTEQDSDEFIDDSVEDKIKEADLIPPAARHEKESKAKVVIVEPKYRTISVGSIHGLVGKPIRILKRNGKVITGSLKKIRGSDAYIAQRMRTGFATTPISIATIRKLEVYR